MPNQIDINILVVDDIRNNLETMHAVLSRPGLNVLRAASGEAALELLLQHEVALALLDVNMPVMDGFALAELMRGNPRTRQIPLIFITAALHEPRRTFAGYRTGAVDFLHKPFEPEILRGKVEVFVDLYVQKKALAIKVKELQEALHTNEMFVAVLGHDLRTPLSAVINGAELIGALSTDAKIRSTAERINASGVRMENMVRQLLDTANIRAGQICLNLSNGDYRLLAEAVVSEHMGRDGDVRIKLSADGNTVALYDHDRIAQALSNLIGNAIEHGHGGQPVTVAIDGNMDGTVALHVRNAGDIPPDRLALIFEPFQSGRPDRTSSSGLGLGLYIVKQFIDAHGGKVEVRSSKGNGTVFSLYLPRRPKAKSGMNVVAAV